MQWNLKKRSRLIYAILVFVGVLMLVTLVTTGTAQRVFMILTFVALAGYIIVWAVLWRCPYCGMPLGRMDSAKFCKHCGKKLYRSE